jgi:N-acetyl sugar amidotransferase
MYQPIGELKLKNLTDSSEAKWGQLAPTGLPERVEFCRVCVLPNQKPITAKESSHTKNHKKSTIRFKDGICDACRWAEMKNTLVNWDDRERELRELCDQHRRNDGRYDVVVPASGGKDSRYVAHLLREKYNMNPLTTTWKPHMFTPVGLRNYLSLIDIGFPNIMISPKGNVQRTLTALAFKNLGHPFQPFIVGQRVVGPKVALDHDIKLVFYGENVAEYGNRIEDNFSPLMDPALYTCFDFNQQNLDEFALAGLTLRDLTSNLGFTLNDLQPYKSPSLERVHEAGIQVHYMSYYRKWSPQENFYYAAKHTKFQQADSRKDGSYSKYAGIDDVIEDLHFYMQLIKFGMGRCTWDAAQEIRAGHLERDEAVALVKKYDQEPPKEFLPEILEYMSISKSEFWSIVDSFRSPHLWKKLDDGNFVLSQSVS